MEYSNAYQKDQLENLTNDSLFLITQAQYITSQIASQSFSDTYIYNALTQDWERNAVHPKVQHIEDLRVKRMDLIVSIRKNLDQMVDYLHDAIELHDGYDVDTSVQLLLEFLNKMWNLRIELEYIGRLPCVNLLSRLVRSQRWDDVEVITSYCPYIDILGDDMIKNAPVQILLQIIDNDPSLLFRSEGRSIFLIQKAESYRGAEDGLLLVRKILQLRPNTLTVIDRTGSSNNQGNMMHQLMLNTLVAKSSSRYLVLFNARIRRALSSVKTFLVLKYIPEVIFDKFIESNVLNPMLQTDDTGKTPLMKFLSYPQGCPDFNYYFELLMEGVTEKVLKVQDISGRTAYDMSLLLDLEESKLQRLMIR